MNPKNPNLQPQYTADTHALLDWMLKEADFPCYEKAVLNPSSETDKPNHTRNLDTARLKHQGEPQLLFYLRDTTIDCVDAFGQVKCLDASERSIPNSVSLTTKPSIHHNQQTQSNHFLPQSQILEYARFLGTARKPRAIMPETIRQAALRAIQARETQHEWYRIMNKDGQYDHLNSTHEHFIIVLRQAVKLMQPCIRRPPCPWLIRKIPVFNRPTPRPLQEIGQNFNSQKISSSRSPKLAHPHECVKPHRSC